MLSFFRTRLNIFQATTLTSKLIKMFGQSATASRFGLLRSWVNTTNRKSWKRTLQRAMMIEPIEARIVLDAIPALVRDIRPGTPSTFFSGSRTQVGDNLFFTANDGAVGSELWRSDGTEQGTVLVKDIRPGNAGSNSSDPAYLTNVGGTLFFRANDGTAGSELWKSDGTEEGTVLVKDIRVGSSSSSIRELTNADGTLFFSANDGSGGEELWRSDGTEKGTFRVTDIRPGSYSSFPSNLTNFDGALYFSANDGTSGTELWKSDGTEPGTELVMDIGLLGIGSFPELLTNVDGTLYFSANDGSGFELWKSDGSETGTDRVKDIRAGMIGSNPGWLINVGGTLFFRANDGINGFELWKSDGTEEGTVLVRDIRISGNSYPLYLINVSGTLFFRADSGPGNNDELWRSDGTEQGTVLVKEIRPGSVTSLLSNLTNLNGTLYFSADDGTSGYELWKSDGTEKGTSLVLDIRPGSSGSNPNFLTNLQGTLFFTANDGTYGTELWSIPAATTAQVVDSYVYHKGSAFAAGGANLPAALDNGKQLAREGAIPMEMAYENLINTAPGINGLVFDIDGLPGNLTEEDFDFQVSPMGAFDQIADPPSCWQSAPAPSSLAVQAGSPSRVIIEWPDNAISNRWLRVTIKANANTGLAQSDVYYLGHLLGETTGPTGGVLTVAFADITPIRSEVGQSVDASSIHDIDKNGVVAFADISAMRSGVGSQLTNITIPAAGSGCASQTPGLFEFDKLNAQARSAFHGRTRLYMGNAAPLPETKLVFRTEFYSDSARVFSLNYWPNPHQVESALTQTDSHPSDFSSQCDCLHNQWNSDTRIPFESLTDLAHRSHDWLAQANEDLVAILSGMHMLRMELGSS